jgi:hypothetical protein
LQTVFDMVACDGKILVGLFTQSRVCDEVVIVCDGYVTVCAGYVTVCDGCDGL